ncbi:hypothetical protein cypCar_00035215, partial [Cyprinus carpio]
HILGVPTQDLLRVPALKDDVQDEIRAQLPYLHLLHCFWQSTYGVVREAIDAFEKALGTVTKLDLIHTLWLDYLSFASSKMLAPQPSVRELKMFTGLVHRCLETVPSRLTLPFSSSQYWSCFSFHNKVISFYVGCFPQSQHSLILERLQHIMPTNTELAIRLLQQEWQDGNVEHFKLQSRMLCCSVPTCLAIWKILTSDAPAEGWDVLTQFPSKDEGLHTEWALDISKPEDLGSQFTVHVETPSAQSAPTATSGARALMTGMMSACDAWGSPTLKPRLCNTFAQALVFVCLSYPKSAPTQQPGKRCPLPKWQGPWPKIVLDPAPQKTA